MTDPTLRNSLGRPLTWTELDANFTTLQNSANLNFTQSGTGAATSTVQTALRQATTINAAAYHQDGDVDDTASFQRAATYAATFTVPVRYWIPPGVQWELSDTVDLDLQENSVIDARGALIVASHDGVLFDLNPDATAAAPAAGGSETKRGITWLGGELQNSNATKTASVAIQAYMMRMLRVEGVKCGGITAGTGFYAFVKFGGLDTYRFIDCYSYGCVRHYWVPVPGTIYPSASTTLDVIDVEWRGSHMALLSTDEAGIYFENRVTNLHVNGGSMNGEPTVAHVYLQNNTDAGSTTSRQLAFKGVHFEQMATGKPAVQFVDGGVNRGFNNVSFDGGCLFSSANAGWQAVNLDRCLDAYFGVCEIIDGSGGKTERGIRVDNDSRRISIAEQCRFVSFQPTTTITNCADNGSGLIRVTAAGHGRVTGDHVLITGVTGTTEANATWLVTRIDDDNVDLVGSVFASAYVAAGTLMAYNAVALESKLNRRFVAIEPQSCSPSGPSTASTAVVLTNFNTTAKSTTADTVTQMAEQLSSFSTFLLPPKGYDLRVNVNDSASAAGGANTCWAKMRRPNESTGGGGDSTAGGLRVACAAAPNDSIVSGSGYVAANDDGAITFSCNASGAGTLDVRIEVVAVRQ